MAEGVKEGAVELGPMCLQVQRGLQVVSYMVFVSISTR